MAEPSDKRNVSRRQFIKKASVGATAALTMAGLNVDVANAKVAPPRKWDEETDVVVVGYGGGGAVSAINAADAGAQVVVLEKNPADLHICNTNVCGGGFCGPVSTDPKDVENGFQYIKACIGDTVDDDLCHLWAEQTSTNRDYLKKLADAVGLPSEIMQHGTAEFPNLPGAESIGLWNLKSGPGVAIFEILNANVKTRKNIRVEFSSPAKKIVQDSNGEILGIIAERNGQQVSVRGRRATVLSCGGFEYNERLKLNYFFGRPRYFYGTDSNTGDGVVMAMAVGADLWHMNWASQHYGFHFKNFPVGMSAFNGLMNDHTSAKKWGFMIVDQYGKRYFNESDHGHSSYLYMIYFDPSKGVYPRLPSYAVFDESVRLCGEPLSTNEMWGGRFGAKVGKYKYLWSKDQSVEIEKGWIMKADTIEDLAKAIIARQGPNPIVDYPSSVKMDPAALPAAVNTYNGYARAGSDREFGRKNIAPIEKGPFYAVEVWACGPNTQGGPRFNTKLQVVDPFGAPIPRLYKAGELGSIYGERYPNGGGNIAEILAFGRIAGQNAAKEKPQA